MTTTDQGKMNIANGFFSIACLGARGWAVAYSRRRIPGAILRSREAALRYVTEIAGAAGLARIRLEIVDESMLLRNASHG